MIVLFSVKSGCEDCDQVFDELSGAAYSYQLAQVDVPTFFGVVYYNTRPLVKAIFDQHKFKTVPYLATSEMVQKRDDGDFYKMEDIWRIKKDSAFETQ